MAATGPISLIPATLKEASLDSPTFRGTVLHYAEQVDLIEKWLDGFIKASSTLVRDVLALEDPISNFLLRAVPTNISESALDHDHTLLAMQRYAEGSRGFWTNVITGARKVETLVVDPLSAFQRGELKNFKEIKRLLEAAQNKYDALLARYLSQNKSKEPSALREDAFALYEARKAYIKTSFDFCIAAPLFRSNLDKLLTKVISNQWREQMSMRDDNGNLLKKCGADVERIRSCYDSMEANERLFLKQLTAAGAALEKRAYKDHQPARELDEYSISTVPYLSRQPAVGAHIDGEDVPSEKQGWLFMRTITGKPTRQIWIRRWFFVKAGVFGWLVQGYREGGAEESEKVGVLLCNIKPAVGEERRFCFEVKTKDTTILLQTETQADLTSWLGVFEQAKRTAVASSNLVASSQAFSIIPPSAPAPPSEPAYVTKGHEGNSANSAPLSDSLNIPRQQRQLAADDGLTFSRSATMGPLGGDSGTRAASMDVPRDFSQMNLQPGHITHGNRERSVSAVSAGAIGGPGHVSVGPGASSAGTVGAAVGLSQPFHHFPSADSKWSSLAPNTLTSTPAPVNLLTAATVTSGNGIAAISEINREKGHKKTMSLDHGKEQGEGQERIGEYPNDYPPELRMQDEHFRMLFPGAKDKLVLLVFRALWSPSPSQSLPGRCFVTERTIYFYSHYVGLVFTTETPFEQIQEIKSAQEKDCDYLFLHLKPDENDEYETQHVLTVKTFLEPMRLLQRRLQALMENANGAVSDPGANGSNGNGGKEASAPQVKKLKAREMLKKLVEMENDEDKEDEQWEDVGMYLDGPAARRPQAGGQESEVKLRIETDRRAIEDRSAPRVGAGQLRLPNKPVVYTPPGMTKKSVERDFDISPKALFHVMFGEKSPVFRNLYSQRRDKPVHQGHWKELDTGKMRRQFAYRVSSIDVFGRARRADVVDHQTIDKQEDHLCYVVTDTKTPWHLPHRADFVMVSKIVITHVAKSKCRLSIWTRVVWFKDPKFSKGIVQKQALEDLEHDALDLNDIVSEAVTRLTSQKQPNAITMFGSIGGEHSPGEGPSADTQLSGLPPAAIDALSAFAGGTGSGKTSLANKRMSRAPPSDPHATRPHPNHRVSRLLAPRIPIKQHRLSQMLWENCLSWAESTISNIFTLLLAAVKTGFSIVTAHRILILALGLSVVANMSLTTRASRAFWSERRAASFLDQVGVKPDGIMSRAITVIDLNEAIAPRVSINSLGSFSSLSYDAPGGMAAGNGGNSTGRCAAKFWHSPSIQAGQEKLGVVRHDLVVAIRMVNSMEKDMVRAEWERWVVGERRRCAMVRRVLGDRITELEEGDEKIGLGGLGMEGLEEYCDDCSKAAEKLGIEEGRGLETV
ncbi:Similar to Uncharacterized PH domain-containing protein C19A8.02; acc. no. O13818 [Pyronema omphalodes CBS 100304]|uniref:Similar to Uncharacterized PH domain-containing protein C19A8.02 acc. no. O13818 n=1 Tax=Pyronema omphalodes (strain CBS 100304) TaxID=1076935 RepID=U4LR20_PYROM|nr:Similar to Uncharacterized PH domain-containing protein C19A8.02; acc. no. O13818 [Pyronema omphalodes CBS 100304]